MYFQQSMSLNHFAASVDSDTAQAQKLLEHFQIMQYFTIEMVRAGIISPPEARDLLKVDKIIALAKD